MFTEEEEDNLGTLLNSLAEVRVSEKDWMNGIGVNTVNFLLIASTLNSSKEGSGPLYLRNQVVLLERDFHGF